MSYSLGPHGLQHADLPNPSPSPGTCLISCPLSWWCHPTISPSVLPFFACSQYFPTSGSFLTGQFFAPGGQSIGVSTSASVLPMNTQDRSPLGWTGWLSLQSTGLSGVFSNTTVQKHKFFSAQPSIWSNSHIHTWLLEKPSITLTRWTFVSKVVSLLFNALSRLFIAFLPRRKHLLISWLQSPSAVILEPKKIKSVTVSIGSPSICHEVMEPDAMILVFGMLSFNPAFSLSSFTFIKSLFSSSSLCAIRLVSSEYLRLLVCFIFKIQHLSEIIEYLSFSDWLISLSTLTSKSIHVAANGKMPFIFMSM